ncbi:MAG TPA: site-specific DNA-methyltransferase [Candidatus Lokiarchaeia archaeon]|nr:site-specific DNA-methyltransferase [Candidatus Lokiarchaeia archaeon]
MSIPSLLVNRIFYEDCVAGLARPEYQGVISLIFADPPYNVSGKAMANVFEHGNWEKIDAEWDQMPPAEYEEFTIQWLAGAYSALKEGGTLMISASYHNAFLIGYLAQKQGFQLRGDVIWYKRTAVPNVTRRTYRHSTEILIWLTKGNKYTFNYEVAKLFTGDNKQLRNLWDILKVGQKESVGHPAQKPEELLLRVIAIHSKPGDVVCDPFAGSGTTLKVAKLLNRPFFGFEVDEADFGAIIERRVQETRFVIDRVQQFFEENSPLLLTPG